MAKKILRAIDRWRFEAPLAALLGVAAGFAVAAMPASVFAQMPVVGAYGLMGQGVIAALAAVLAGVVGYALMRAPAKPGIDAATLAEARQEETPEERLHRVRRADRHPDAPPRAPIRASRDLGEPLMEVGLFFQEPTGQTETDMILDGEFVELTAELPAPHPAEPDAGEMETLDAVEDMAEAAPVEEIAPVEEEREEVVPVMAAAPVPPVAPAPILRAVAPRERQSLDAMIDRLSAGLDRRAALRGMDGPVGEAPRDMRPALREALEELNRLASRA
ncbi:hypothetical protein [Sphingomonas sp. PR090111-T3T-6A]|uniref:hypothetical protein n=1 Tax=Sphingomonas sp. PR090111-T3T-6A TaxID=685778 RepID=UPI00037511BF|nr:hypothetical protein [Sphingomonas sp. PR090111-T3T-6A]